jgi:hypothetical protein
LNADPIAEGTRPISHRSRFQPAVELQAAS